MTDHVLEGSVLALLGVLGWLCLTLIKNNLAIQSLTLEIKYMRESISPLPKLQKDLDVLHQWKRDIEKDMKK